jgi:hypothetical protein
VLSSDSIQSAILRDHGLKVEGLTPVEYTVWVEGGGQRTSIVICQEGTDTCFAASPDRRFPGPGEWVVR